jgi:hypothetical protein
MTRPTTSDPWTAVSGDPSASEITFNATTQKFTRSDKHGNVSEYLVSATGLAMVVKAVDRLGVGRKYAYSDHDVDGAAVELDSIAIVRTGQVDEVTNYNYTTVSGNHQRVTSIVGEEKVSEKKRCQEPFLDGQSTHVILRPWVDRIAPPPEVTFITFSTAPTRG